MSATSALPAIATATPATAAPLRADSANAAGAVDFAGLIGLAVANSTMPAEVAAADDIVDAEPPVDDDETDTAAGATPPLLNWLFGLMAATGATLPAAAGAADGASPDAKALPLKTANLPAAGGAPPATDAQLPMPPSAPLTTGAEVPAPVSPQVGWELAAAASSEIAADAARDPGGPWQLPGVLANARAMGGVPETADAGSIGSDATDVAPTEFSLVDAQTQQPAERSFAELLTPMREAGGADALRELTQAGSGHAAEAALLMSAATANLSRTSAPAADVAAAFLSGGVLSPLSDGFVSDLGEHIEWQLADGVSEARIELHPAELGALTVRIETQGDQARVHIVAAEAATRSLLNQAMPQLRELLAGSGLNLARSQVDSSDRRDGRSGERGNHPPATSGIRRRITQVLLVDAYA
ncbi:MAG: flagellar hook-length control protein FliK [Sinimarinibacterium sp.]|jgi:flagellar hook-length control protein FliK